MINHDQQAAREQTTNHLTSCMLQPMLPAIVRADEVRTALRNCRHALRFANFDGGDATTAAELCPQLCLAPSWYQAHAAANFSKSKKDPSLAFRIVFLAVTYIAVTNTSKCLPTLALFAHVNSGPTGC
jgi:hypothetical protein